MPPVLAQALWAHVRRESPREGVGAIGGWAQGDAIYARALYPLPNVAAQPEREYLADAGALLRSLRAMEAESLRLVAFYHSHPCGPGEPSETDSRLAAYPVPYLIADLRGRTLRAYRLPTGEQITLLETNELE